VMNILNTMYVSNGWTYSYIYGGRQYTDNFYYPQAGRNFMAGLSLKF
jgi:iron complex outermembrane recepter protein